MKKPLILLGFAVLSLLFCSPAFSQPSLKVGVLIPFSGRWGEAGRECAKGMIDAGKWVNQRGGVFGRRLEVSVIDDTSQVAETVAAFRKFGEADHVVLLYLFSMETGLSLMPHLHHRRIPTLVSSLPTPWTNPVKYPYAFSMTPTPLDLAKIGVKFLSERTEIKGRKPKLLFLGSPDLLGREAAAEAREHAVALGMDVAEAWVSEPSPAPDRPIEDFQALLRAVLQHSPDYAYVSLSSKEAASLIEKAREIGAKTKWMCGMKAFDETLAGLEGVYGVQPVSPYGDDVPGMASVREAHQRWHPYDAHTLSYVEGWATAQVIAEALGRALPEQRLSRDSVKAALEGFRDFVLGGLLPPVTFTARDHRPSMEARVFVIRGGKLARDTGFIAVERGKP